MIAPEPPKAAKPAPPAHISFAGKNRRSPKTAADHFEHRHYVPLHATCNKLLEKRWEDYVRDLHMSRLKQAKPSIDDSKPRVYKHLDMRLKKQQLEEERVHEIERNNNILFRRIMNQKISHTEISDISNIKAYIQNRNHMAMSHEHNRRRGVEKIVKENLIILQRIEEKAPNYNRLEWYSDRYRNLGYLCNIAQYPKHYLDLLENGKSNYDLIRPHTRHMGRDSSKVIETGGRKIKTAPEFGGDVGRGRPKTRGAPVSSPLPDLNQIENQPAKFKLSAANIGTVQDSTAPPVVNDNRSIKAKEDEESARAAIVMLDDLADLGIVDYNSNADDHEPQVQHDSRPSSGWSEFDDAVPGDTLIHVDSVKSAEAISPARVDVDNVEISAAIVSSTSLVSFSDPIITAAKEFKAVEIDAQDAEAIEAYGDFELKKTDVNENTSSTPKFNEKAVVELKSGSVSNMYQDWPSSSLEPSENTTKIVENEYEEKNDYSSSATDQKNESYTKLLDEETAPSTANLTETQDYSILADEYEAPPNGAAEPSHVAGNSSSTSKLASKADSNSATQIYDTTKSEPLHIESEAYRDVTEFANTGIEIAPDQASQIHTIESEAKTASVGADVGKVTETTIESKARPAFGDAGFEKLTEPAIPSDAIESKECAAVDEASEETNIDTKLSGSSVKESSPETTETTTIIPYSDGTSEFQTASSQSGQIIEAPMVETALENVQADVKYDPQSINTNQQNENAPDKEIFTKPEFVEDQVGLISLETQADNPKSCSLDEQTVDDQVNYPSSKTPLSKIEPINQQSAETDEAQQNSRPVPLPPIESTSRPQSSSSKAIVLSRPVSGKVLAPISISPKSGSNPTSRPISGYANDQDPALASKRSSLPALVKTLSAPSSRPLSGIKPLLRNLIDSNSAPKSAEDKASAEVTHELAAEGSKQVRSEAGSLTSLSTKQRRSQSQSVKNLSSSGSKRKSIQASSRSSVLKNSGSLVNLVPLK